MTASSLADCDLSALITYRVRSNNLFQPTGRERPAAE